MPSSGACTPPFRPEHVTTCNERAHPMSCTHPPGPRGLRGASWRCRAVLQSTIVPRSPHSAPSAEAPIWPQIQLCATRTFVPTPWVTAGQTFHFGPPTGPAERLRGPPACREASRPASTPRLSANGGFRISASRPKTDSPHAHAGRSRRRRRRPRAHSTPTAHRGGVGPRSAPLAVPPPRRPARFPTAPRSPCRRPPSRCRGERLRRALALPLLSTLPPDPLAESAALSHVAGPPFRRSNPSSLLTPSATPPISSPRWVSWSPGGGGPDRPGAMRAAQVTYGGYARPSTWPLSRPG